MLGYFKVKLSIKQMWTQQRMLLGLGLGLGLELGLGLGLGLWLCCVEYTSS